MASKRIEKVFKQSWVKKLNHYSHIFQHIVQHNIAWNIPSEGAKHISSFILFVTKLVKYVYVYSKKHKKQLLRYVGFDPRVC